MSSAPRAGNLTGSLLIAHPSLIDPNFRRTILFLSHHSAEEGAVGLVLNRPMHVTLGESTNVPQSDPLAAVAMHYGGPVAREQVMLASFQWRENPQSLAFRSFPGGVDEAAAVPEWGRGLRAFSGYSGWSQGQLENEIAQKAWIVTQPTKALVEPRDVETVWREVMHQSGPVLKLLAEAPDHVEWN
jgi:putative transcriptional regulator